VIPERFDDEFKLYNLAIGFDTGAGKLSASTSYVDRHFDDSQSTPYEFLDQFLLAAPVVFNPTRAQQINDVKDFTQELRWTSPQQQDFRYTGGLYYEHMHRHYLEDVITKGFDSYFSQFVPGFNSPQYYGTPAPDDFFYGPIDITERQFAAFGEATYSITPRVDVTGGLRYYNFKQDFNLFFTGLAGALNFNEPLTGAGVEKASGANPRGVVSFKQTQDVMWYAEAARGFRYGGVNEPVPKQFCDPNNQGLNLGPPTFGPDKLWNYSVGEKGTFGPMTLNVDAFFIDWKDAPIRVDLSCGYYYSANLGHLHSKGLELETRWHVTPNLALGVGGSYTDAYTVNDIPQISALAGDRAPYFPKVIASLNGEYGVAVGAGRLGLAADFTYRSSAYTQFSDAQVDRFGNVLQQEIPASRLLNAVIDFSVDHWRIGVFGKNLTNDLGITNRTARIYGSIEPAGQQSISRPRTVGASARYQF
jgi:outer membrane receptor protein involved in Fe transport